MRYDTSLASERKQPLWGETSNGVLMPEIKFDFKKDNLNELIRHPETDKKVKRILEKLRMVSLKQFHHISNRFVQVVSYSKQIVSLIFEMINIKDKRQKRRKLAWFGQMHNKMK